MSPTRIAIGALAGFSAGFVDAVVGGGGLIQLPSITLLLPEGRADIVLGTNKFAAVSGTSVAAMTLRDRLRSGLRSLLPAVFTAMVASFGGARLSSLVPTSSFKPIIICALLVVLVITVKRPDLGTRVGADFSGRRSRMIGIAAVVGFYDGLIGPGTGTFFTIALVGLARFDFLEASATAKVLNVGTNLAALSWFLPHRAIAWALAVPMAIANLSGGFIGARLALRKGAAFVRVFFLVVVGALIVRLTYDVLR